MYTPSVVVLTTCLRMGTMTRLSQDLYLITPPEEGLAERVEGMGGTATIPEDEEAMVILAEEEFVLVGPDPGSRIISAATAGPHDRVVDPV